MRDEVFDGAEPQTGSFRFNESVASAFDDMAVRCIPYYKEIIRLTCEAASRMLPQQARIFDIGCSTANTLLALARSCPEKNFQLTGCDPSAEMIAKAREKCELFTYSHDIEFICSDCQSLEIPTSDMVIMNYTLQFIPPAERPSIIRKIYQSLKPGGIFILSEKLRQDSPLVEKFNTAAYEQFKADNGYSFLEIANKRQALENILIPQSLTGNTTLLSEAGFSTVEPLFKWLNFATFIAVKS